MTDFLPRQQRSYCLPCTKRLLSGPWQGSLDETMCCGITRLVFKSLILLLLLVFPSVVYSSLLPSFSMLITLNNSTLLPSLDSLLHCRVRAHGRSGVCRVSSQPSCDLRHTCHMCVMHREGDCDREPATIPTPGPLTAVLTHFAAPSATNPTMCFHYFHCTPSVSLKFIICPKVLLCSTF